MLKSNIKCSRFHDGTAFSWKKNHGVIEVSTLGKNPFCQVYKDAVDLGFGIVGNKRDIIFAVDTPVVENEEVVGWEMKSISEPGFFLTVFND